MRGDCEIMEIKSNRWENRISCVFAVQLCCLLIMGAAEFLNMTNGCFPKLPVHLLMNAGIVLSLLGFWGITLWKAPRSMLQRDVILGILMVVWFLVLEMNRRLNYIPLQSVTIFTVVYLLALPFAAITQDQNRQIGIRLVSGIYIAASLLFVAFGLLLFVGGKIPGALNGQVYWDGARLFVMHHPNITSRMFVIALALCMGFCGRIKKIWASALMLLAAILLFAAIALANCRAVILPSCCILAGNVFFWIGTKNRKRILMGVVAAMLVAAAAFWFTDWLYDWNTARLYDRQSLQATQEQVETREAPVSAGTLSVRESTNPKVMLLGEASVSDGALSDHEVINPKVIPLSEAPKWKPEGNGNSSQGTFMDDLPTLNGRATIWTAFLQKIVNDPAILLRGTIDSRLVLKNLHTHNAWLEALIMLGLPGLILVLVLCWNATWACLRLLWHGGIGLFEKNIAMLVLSMLVSALLEPCLFITYQEWSFFDFFFFLCLGYLTLWNKQIPRRNKA